MFETILQFGVSLCDVLTIFSSSENSPLLCHGSRPWTECALDVPGRMFSKETERIPDPNKLHLHWPGESHGSNNWHQVRVNC